MSAAKILRPPFKWSDGKTGIIEDQQYKRWDIPTLRAMRNGTYNWKTHQEKRIGS